MRILAALGLAGALLVPAATGAAAKPRVDRSFGLHQGYWVRTDGAWALPAGVAAPAGGSALVVSSDGRVTRIAASGKADGGWGIGGTVDLGGADRSMWFRANTDAARWNGRYLLTAATGSSNEPLIARVVDTRGRTLPVTDPVQAALTFGPVPPSSYYDQDHLVPAPDGRLWDLRGLLVYGPGPHQDYRASLSLLDAQGAPLQRDRINLVSLPGMLVGQPVPSGRRLIVPTMSRTLRVTLRRLLEDGSIDRDFHPVDLEADDGVAQALPWHGGAIVVTDKGRVYWISDTGRVVRRRDLGSGVRVGFDTARRLVVVSDRRNRASVTVRRLRANGTVDRSFGTVRLRAAGRLVEGLGVVPAPDGRLLVVGRSVVKVDDVREDFTYNAHATVVWRIRTR